MDTALRASLVRLAAIAALSGLGAGATGAAIINVGSGGAGAGCETTSLETAIAMAAATTAADEIRLQANVTWELGGPLHFTDWNSSTHGALTLSGGWPDCSATTPADARSGISWWGVQPIIEVDTSGAAASFLTLRRIELLFHAVAPLVVQGNAVVNLLDSEIAYSDEVGIRVEAGGYLFVDHLTEIYENGDPTEPGGGIFCGGEESFVDLDGTVAFNRAYTGGAIHVEEGCEVALGGTAYLLENEAILGGGVYAASGAVVTGTGWPNITGNTASSSGGGVFADGAGTYVFFGSAVIRLNRAGFAAAGIHVGANALVILDGGGACAGGYTCPSLLVENQLLAGARNGAAGLAQTNGVLELRQTRVRSNEVPEAEPHGSILYASAGGKVRTESAQVSVNSGANRVFLAEAGGEIQVAFTTVGANYYEVGGFDTPAAGVHVTGTGSVGRIYSSLFHPSAGFQASSGGAFTKVDCLIAETTAGLPGAPTSSYVFAMDPLYTNLAAGFRLRPDSPAIDFCDSAFYPPTQSDLHGRARGFDVPENPNGSPGPSGHHDLGAYEEDFLFFDGFESGGTSAWDATS